MLGADVAPAAPLMAAGLDSLGAVELRSAITVKFPTSFSHDNPLVILIVRHVKEGLA